MGNNDNRVSCYKCNFLKRSLSSGNSLIYLCQKWQLRCNGILPYKTVKDSIGRECPFFISKQKLPKTQADEDNNKNNFDVIA